MTEKDFELQELRRRLQFLEKENEKLTHIHQLDMAEIKYQRRQIDFLTDSLMEASR